MLKEIGVEDRPLSKYYTKCPKCGPRRDNTEKDSLGVYKVGDVAYLRCYHSEQCEWNTPHKVKLEESESQFEVIHKQEFEIPVPEGAKPPDAYEGVTIYEYRDLDGRLQGIVKRAMKDGKKVIRPFFYEKNMGWISAWPTGHKLLYGAHLLKSEKPILIVEGEKAADFGQLHLSERFIVVTWPGGSSQTTNGDWDLLTGREIYIWPDNDAPGLKAANTLAAELRSSKIKIFQVSHFGAGWDVADLEPRLVNEEVDHLLQTAVPFAIAPEDALTDKKFKTDLNQKLSDRRYGYTVMDKGSRPPDSGLVIFLGRSAHGKSLFIYNLMRNQLKQGNKVTLFSYEIPASRAFVKLLMAGEHLPETGTRESYWGDYHVALREGRVKSEEETIQRMTSKQLAIVDRNYSADELLMEITKPGYYGSTIFIDYIQLIPAGEAGSRYLEIQAICNRLREAANQNNLLIVTAAQLTPSTYPAQDHVREGKDIFFAAEQVFKIWNKAQGTVEGVGKYMQDVPGDVLLQVVKNRNGTTGKVYSFDLKNGAELREKV